MNDERIYELIRKYESISSVELYKTIDALKVLVEDDKITDETAERIMRLLVSRHLHKDITHELYIDDLDIKNNRKLKFINFKYGRTKETYA